MQQMKLALIHSDIAEALETLGFSAANAESEEIHEMQALAKEVYYRYFAGQKPISEFAIFTGKLLLILAENAKEAKEDTHHADTTTDSTAPN